MQAQPITHRIGLAITDEIDQETLPDYMQRRHNDQLRTLTSQLRLLFEDLGRFETSKVRALHDGRRYQYKGDEDVEYIAHVFVHKLYKIYRNEVLYHFSNHLVEQSRALGGGNSDYEIISEPAIVGRLEIRLVDQARNKIIWSTMRDTAQVVSYDRRLAIYNPSKYPGLTHPMVIQNHLADIVKLQVYNRSVERMLGISDRWHISSPQDDLQTTEELLYNLVGLCYPDLDGNLPLEGQIAALLPDDAKGKTQVAVNMGTSHGLYHKLRLDLYRPLPSTQKVGQIEIVSVDSATAVGRLRKLEKKLKKAGEGPQPGDRVISRKRRSTRRRDSL